ncbi:HNH endonuclease domain-containing protein [uncultured Pedobacter sp.]|uniref:HNH endonuclease domain-containing protein n=1 Tax=uncultured Pedobacter sp. TaxID=246139 RepID=UPI00345DCA24
MVHGSFAVEHFIPYAFVSHDLIWNLIPADPSFNSRKNNKLPGWKITLTDITGCKKQL